MITAILALALTGQLRELPEEMPAQMAKVLDFTAAWCGPCRAMAPEIDDLIAKGWPVVRVDADKRKDLVARYKVDALPTLVMIDAQGNEIDRSSIYRTAAVIGSWIREHSHQYDERTPIFPFKAPAEQRIAAASKTITPVNPEPWRTAVRIRVRQQRFTGFGSGTVIFSDDQNAIILTCAHIFKGNGKSSPISVDLFGDQLYGRQVKFDRTVAGVYLASDPVHDLGLLRISSGNRLPASRVVPTYWRATSGMSVHATGCAEGRDATIFTTQITRPRVSNFLQGNPEYECIECNYPPAQGRSGGSLFTDDGYLCGVCDFAEPGSGGKGKGLYSSPDSIRRFLGAHGLAAVADPVYPQRTINETAALTERKVHETCKFLRGLFSPRNSGNVSVNVNPEPPYTPATPSPVAPTEPVAPAPAPTQPVVIAPATPPVGIVSPPTPAPAPVVFPSLVIRTKQPNGTLSAPSVIEAQNSPSLGKPAYFVTLDLNPPAPTPVPAK
jgi:thiol-disulfide isomerase/thioredoxin